MVKYVKNVLIFLHLFSIKKVEGQHLPEQAEPVKSSVFAPAVVVTAVVSTVIAVAGLLIKNHLSEIKGLINLTSTADGRSAMFTNLFFD